MAFTVTLIILDITKIESSNSLFYHTLTEKNGSNLFASSLTASNIKHPNLILT